MQGDVIVAFIFELFVPLLQCCVAYSTLLRHFYTEINTELNDKVRNNL